MQLVGLGVGSAALEVKTLGYLSDLDLFVVFMGQPAAEVGVCEINFTQSCSSCTGISL